MEREIEIVDKNRNSKMEAKNESLKYYDRWIICKKTFKLMMIDDETTKDICKNYHDEYLKWKNKY